MSPSNIPVRLISQVQRYLAQKSAAGAVSAPAKQIVNGSLSLAVGSVLLTIAPVLCKKLSLHLSIAAGKVPHRTASSPSLEQEDVLELDGKRFNGLRAVLLGLSAESPLAGVTAAEQAQVCRNRTKVLTCPDPTMDKRGTWIC